MIYINVLLRTFESWYFKQRRAALQAAGGWGQHALGAVVS